LPRIDLAYARALVEAAPLGDLAGAALRRAARLVRRRRRRRVTVEEARAGAAALQRAPHLFTSDDLSAAYRELFPDGIERFRRRAEQLLAHQIDLFGVTVAVGAKLDWHRDPRSGRRFDPRSIELPLDGGGPDPKQVWELARGGHLVELAAASCLLPELRARVRAELTAQIDSFLDGNLPGRGIHHASPLEVALRALHWLAALELAGGARRFPLAFLERMAASLIEEGFFLAHHLEDTGAVPANHLLGDLVGLLAIGLALDGTAGAARWVALAARRIPVEAARQVGQDGAHFEASTAYHRFALELLLVAHRLAGAAGLELGLGPTLASMLEYVRGYLAPDGSEPAFGDGDDARLLPIVPRAPRDHGYLLPVGVAVLGAVGLRQSAAPFAEEALWLGGLAGRRAWEAAAPEPEPGVATFPSGGVHVLRSRSLYVAMRSGPYGQRGVGGHAHNDQLSLVVYVDGEPLIVDPGTGSYTHDPVVRDRFRGTAAHSTLVVDGAEQSPFLDGRPFALPDRARAARVAVEDLGDTASLAGAHYGYRRLGRVTAHRRKVTLHRRLGALVIEDRLDGQGEVAVELRFHLAAPARLGASAQTRARAAVLDGQLGPLSLDRAVEIGAPRAALLPVGECPLVPALGSGWFSPHFGAVYPEALVLLAGRLSLPLNMATAILVI
jgi:hypothetical protein